MHQHSEGGRRRSCACMRPSSGAGAAVDDRHCMDVWTDAYSMGGRRSFTCSSRLPTSARLHALNILPTPSLRALGSVAIFPASGVCCCPSAQSLAWLASSPGEEPPRPHRDAWTPGHLGRRAVTFLALHLGTRSACVCSARQPSPASQPASQSAAASCRSCR